MKVHLSKVGNRRHPLTACGRFWKVEKLRMASKPAEVTCKACLSHMRKVMGVRC